MRCCREVGQCDWLQHNAKASFWQPAGAAHLDEQPDHEGADLRERHLLRRVQGGRLERLADLAAVEEHGHHEGPHALDDLGGREGQRGSSRRIGDRVGWACGVREGRSQQAQAAASLRQVCEYAVAG